MLHIKNACTTIIISSKLRDKFVFNKSGMLNSLISELMFLTSYPYTDNSYDESQPLLNLHTVSVITLETTKYYQNRLSLYYQLGSDDFESHQFKLHDMHFFKNMLLFSPIIN